MITDPIVILRALKANGKLLSHTQVDWALGPDNTKYSVAVLRSMANDGLVQLFHNKRAKSWDEAQAEAHPVTSSGAVLEWRIAVQ